MAVLTKKPLQDAESHLFLTQMGFINVENSFAESCYRDWQGRLLVLPLDRTVRSVAELMEIYLQIGFRMGKNSI